MVEFSVATPKSKKNEIDYDPQPGMYMFVWKNSRVCLVGYSHILTCVIVSLLLFSHADDDNYSRSSYNECNNTGEY